MNDLPHMQYGDRVLLPGYAFGGVAHHGYFPPVSDDHAALAIRRRAFALGRPGSTAVQRARQQA